MIRASVASSLACALLAASMLAAPGCSPQPPSDSERAKGSVARAPEFTIELLNGEQFRMSDHLGNKVVVLDFWTTFCQPCVGSLTHLNEVYKKYKDKGLVVLAVAMDPPDTAGAVSPFVRSHGLSMPVAHDVQSRITDLYNKKSTAPFQVLIGRDGRVIRQRESYQPGDDASIEKDITLALGLLARLRLC